MVAPDVACSFGFLRQPFDRVENKALFDVLTVQGVPHAYPELGGVGTRTTIFSQTRCKKRRRFKPIVTVCRPGIRDGKMEASCSTLRTSLWR